MKKISILVFAFFCTFLGLILPAAAAELIPIGSYETKILSKSSNRLINIKLSAGAINNYTLEPGKTFSFNKVVGIRTPARGYKKADIYIAGDVFEDYGGGICQVSSTLYQATLAAKLKVTEAHRHSGPIAYIGKGMDATVAWGSKDYKFVNNLKEKVVIQTYVDKTKVKVSILKEKPEPPKLPVTILLNGLEVPMAVKPYYQSNTTYIPLRALGEQFGALVQYSKESTAVYYQGKKGVLTVGSNNITVNDQNIKLAAAPIIVDSVTYVPVRCVQYFFGKNIDWDGKNMIVSITDVQVKEEPSPASETIPEPSEDSQIEAQDKKDSSEILEVEDENNPLDLETEAY